MLADVIGALRCPHCAAPLALAAGTAHCRNRHSFDVARHGYLNLMPGPSTGDTSDMVAARSDFLASGNYSPILEAVVSAAAGRDGLIAEIGAGTAYYLAGVVDAGANRRGVALDVSRHAARRAAKAHPRIGAVMADVWHRLPLQDGTASIVLDVFAPRNASEIARIMSPDGLFLLVTPNQSHLRELVGALGLISIDEAKDDRIASSLGIDLAKVSGTVVEFPMHLEHSAVRQLVGMGPSARHLDPTSLNERLAALPDPVTVTASVTLTTWQHGGSIRVR